MAKRRTAVEDPQSGPAGAPAPDPEIAGMGYEQARDALVEVVRRLESGGATLEESLQLWERGEALAARCEQWLQGARARLDAANGAGPAGGRPAGGVSADERDDDEDDLPDEDDPDDEA